MYCPNCGAKNDNSALFCYECGVKLNESGNFILEPDLVATSYDTTKSKQNALSDFISFIGNLFTGIFAILMTLSWGFGGLIGAIYWAVKDELLFCVLSIFIPLFGAITVIWDLLFGF